MTIDYDDGFGDIFAATPPDLPPADTMPTSDLASIARIHSWDRRFPCECEHCREARRRAA